MPGGEGMNGHKRTATAGLVGSAVAFTALAAAALVGSVEASWLGVLLVGFTTGLFNVAVLALMPTMSVPERVALFMGAWTVSHALADGIATAGGGVLHDLVLRVASTEVAYASVFALEAAAPRCAFRCCIASTSTPSPRTSPPHRRVAPPRRWAGRYPVATTISSWARASRPGSRRRGLGDNPRAMSQFSVRRLSRHRRARGRPHRRAQLRARTRDARRPTARRPSS